MATISISACDNELYVIAYQDATSYQLAHILSGHTNSVDVTITVARGPYSQEPQTYNGVNGPLNASYSVAIPAGNYTLLAVGINWGGPINFAVSLDGAALSGSSTGSSVNVVWQANTALAVA